MSVSTPDLDHTSLMHQMQQMTPTSQIINVIIIDIFKVVKDYSSDFTVIDAIMLSMHTVTGISLPGGT